VFIALNYIKVITAVSLKNCHLIPLSDDSRSDDVDSHGVVVVVDVVEEGDVAGQLQHGHEEAKNAKNQHGRFWAGVAGVSQSLLKQVVVIIYQ
jgi:hypothetical protein